MDPRTWVLRKWSQRGINFWKIIFGRLAPVRSNPVAGSVEPIGLGRRRFSRRFGPPREIRAEVSLILGGVWNLGVRVFRRLGRFRQLGAEVAPVLGGVWCLVVKVFKRLGRFRQLRAEVAPVVGGVWCLVVRVFKRLGRFRQLRAEVSANLGGGLRG